jgi:hypothetical protein
VIDLLVPSSNACIPNSLEIRNDIEGNLSVPGLSRERVSGLKDVMEVFARGSMNRSSHLLESVFDPLVGQLLQPRSMK